MAGSGKVIALLNCSQQNHKTAFFLELVQDNFLSWFNAMVAHVV